MPVPRVRRPLQLHTAALPAALVLALLACKSHPSRPSPAPSSDEPATPAGSSSATASTDPPDDGFKPLHPGHVNQRGPNGGFLPARMAPAPSPQPAAKAAVFDGVPEEVKLPPHKEENGHCGELDLGDGEKVFLDCMTDDYTMVAGAAKPTGSSDDRVSLRSPRKLPSLVDHRKDGTEGPIMSQGKSAACTSFSLVAAANYAAARFLGGPAELSPMHAWARYHSPKMTLAENDNLGRGLTDLATLPWDAKLATEWQHGGRVEPGLLHRADAHSVVEITNITRLDGGSISEIKSALASGQDIWFAIRGAVGMKKPKKNADGESMIPHFDSRKTSGASKSGHAIVLAGYEDTPHGTFYLVHNSWGTKWGTDGYAWMWEKTLRANLAEAFVLQVRPVEGARVRHSAPAHKFSNCSAGLAPDAMTTQCVPTCPDGGPRVNGVCPTAGQCPDGEVNLDGKCELSAPDLKKTLSNGVKVSCGLSGCTYVVPNGQESCTASQGCTISCAAPRFILASGPHGLACNG